MADVVVKKYSNRKLYDTSTKKFITLRNIADMLNEGKSVKVVDKKTGKDVTSHVVAALLQKHYDQDKKLLDIPDESPLDLIKNKIKILKIKRSIEIIYDLVKLHSTDKKGLDKIVDALIKEGFITKEMAIETEKTLRRLMKERNVKMEQKITNRLKTDVQECEKIKKENVRLKKELEKLRKFNQDEKGT
jgi:polyhydroxyalkanoate synthesis repressor PhaR